MVRQDTGVYRDWLTCLLCGSYNPVKTQDVKAQRLAADLRNAIPLLNTLIAIYSSQRT
jgi:hypothetical protein